MEKLIPKVGLRPRKICCWCLYNNDVLVNNGKPRNIPYTYDEVIEMGFDIVERR